MRRDNFWLDNKLESIWQKYFSDVKKINPVVIKFSRASKFRFGSIRQVRKNSFLKSKSLSQILVNGNFTKSEVPVGVLEYTIGHELVHYAHGFSSNLPRMHRYPHQGGVVNRELENRGMAKQVSVYKKWLREYRKRLAQEA